MSEIASFTYIHVDTVPFLGFYSKPKPRLFRKPVCRFEELLEPHVLRDMSFAESDGIYIALVCGWLEITDKRFSKECNPVIHSLRRNLGGGSQWLFSYRDRRMVELLRKPMEEAEWPYILAGLECEKDCGFEWVSFVAARQYVADRLSELKDDEAVLVSVG